LANHVLTVPVSVPWTRKLLLISQACTNAARQEEIQYFAAWCSSDVYQHRHHFSEIAETDSFWKNFVR
jgi:ribosomal protein L30E